MIPMPTDALPAAFAPKGRCLFGHSSLGAALLSRKIAPVYVWVFADRHTIPRKGSSLNLLRSISTERAGSTGKDREQDSASALRVSVSRRRPVPPS